MAEMSLQDRLMADLKQAMREGDKVRRSVIRLLRARIKNAEIEQGKALDDSDVLGIVTREVRRHRESITEFKKADRQDLVAQEEAELVVILEYLPRQMSREEIVTAARKLIEEVGAQEPKDKGKVMGRLIAQLKGKADGREVNAVVSELLASL